MYSRLLLWGQLQLDSADPSYSACLRAMEKTGCNGCFESSDRKLRLTWRFLVPPVWPNYGRKW